MLKAKKIPHKLVNHGIERIDNYYWLNKRDDKEVIDYLNTENAYTDEVMTKTKDFQTTLYEEIKNRIKEDDTSFPHFRNGYWYYSRYVKGNEHIIHCRKKTSLDADEEIILDVNLLATGHKYCSVGEMMISDDNRILAYSVDFRSRRIYDIYFYDLVNNILLDDVIKDTVGDFVWAADNKTIFYAKQNKQLRSDKIYRHVLSISSASINKTGIACDISTNSIDTLVFHEKDAKFDVGLSRGKSDKFIYIYSDSTLSTEFRYIKADEPLSEFKIFQKREKEHEYDIDDDGENFYILTNWKAKNFRLMKCPVNNETTKDNWQEIIPHKKDYKIEDFEIFKKFIAIEERHNGLVNIKILSPTNEYYIPVSEELYDIAIDTNCELSTTKLRYSYTSLTTPVQLKEFDMDSKQSTLLKEQEVLDINFSSNNYESQRLWAISHDGIKVPLSIIYKKGIQLNSKNPCLLYGYGSYGYSTDVCFNSARLSLLDRGFIFAIAHIRGGEELGRNWYEDGKFLKKKNTFFDFIACAEYLIANKYTSSEHLYGWGGSAGGLLIGSVANMKPYLFHSLVAEVPFVDVVTTMLDEDIPLTTGEYEEWGNPNDKEYFEYMLSYSPYDNIKQQHYPNMLITAGYHDSQVQYWEPAKYVAKLREYKTDNNILLLKTEMEFGHSGASGKYEALKELSFVYAFILSY
ncbi:oligopeptidase B [Bacteroidia bacterium]|nr:oligopeptidase B [Bacteroidia bacterium]